MRDVKTQAAGTRLVNSNIRPANYPRPTDKENFAQPVPAFPLIPQTPVKLIDTPVIPFDESIFDNSMMISEEDLICNEENFINETEGNIYPILPFKRK